MAHLKDSGIQAHSAGDLFPYVIYVREQLGRKQWHVIGPAANECQPWSSRDAAEDYARQCRQGDRIVAQWADTFFDG